MNNILVVEDDELFSIALKSLLEEAGYTVTVAENGKAAVERLKEGTFKAVVSDFKMPVMNGLELARWVIENKKIPFIMMTGFLESLDTIGAMEAGAIDIIYKPFSREDFLRTLDASLAPKPPSKGDDYNLFPGYAKIPFATAFSGGAADFNLYQESAGRLQKFVSKGEPFSPRNSAVPDSKYVFTEAANLEKLIPMNIEKATAASKNAAADPERKAKLIELSTEILFHKIKIDGLDKQSFDNAVELVKCCLHTINDVDVWNVLEVLNNVSDRAYTETLASMAISAMIAQGARLPMSDCFQATTAAMFHDIGKIYLEPELTQSHGKNLSDRERYRLEKHVELGVSTLKKMKNVSNEICDIVHEHHENCEGTGYPRKLSKDQIHPLARLLYVADEFCLRTITFPWNTGEDPNKTVAAMATAPEFDQNFVKILANLVSQTSTRRKASA